MNLLPVLRQRYFDSDGNPLAGGKLYSYQAGTTTPQATYTDSGGLTANANPVVLDANGEASVWGDPELSYKFVLKDSNDVTLWTVDNVIGLITADAVATASVQDLAITTAKIADDAVTADKLRDDAATDGNRSVTTNHVRDGAITGVKLNANTVDDSSLQLASNQLSIKALGVTTAKLAASAVTAEKIATGVITQVKMGALGQQASGAISVTNFSNASFTDISGASVSITTTGRPVILMVVPSVDGSAADMRIGGDTIGVKFSIRWVRDATALASYLIQDEWTAFPASQNSYKGMNFLYLDAPSAGTYTYKLQGKTSTGTLDFENAKVIAFEL